MHMNNPEQHPSSLTIYCSSSTILDEQFSRTAWDVGVAIAGRGINLVYGGGGIGLMGQLARGCRSAGGHVIGIITKHLVQREQCWDGCDELLVVDSMRERKMHLIERGDGFLMLPGGLGTYEEFFATLVGRQLGEHAKPIAVLNDRDYFDPLVDMIQHSMEHKFIKPAIFELLKIDNQLDPLLDWLEAPPTVDIDPERFYPMGQG